MLRPRCWSGRKRTFSPCSKAHSSARRALDDVHTAPPLRPVNALIAAVEFMYVMGIVTSVMPASASTSQASSTWPIAAMSAIEQPAARSGRITAWLRSGEDVGALGHEVHAREHDVLRVGARRSVARQLEAVAGDVGELDDLVALVVVAEHEDAIAERRLRGAGALDEAGVARGGRSPGHSTPRSLSGSAPRPSSSSASGVGSGSTKVSVVMAASSHWVPRQHGQPCRVSTSDNSAGGRGIPAR